VNISSKVIKIQCITYPVKLSDVLHILNSALVVCLKALASGPISLTLRVEALALRFWPWLHQ